MMRDIVQKLVQQALAKNPTLFLIDVEVTDDNRICVIIDGDKGVTVEDCIAVSREIEYNLDREEFDFSIDVMSSGVSESLSMPRQYHKNMGRNLKIKTRSGEIFEGKLIEANETACTLSWEAREPKPVGKGKVTVQKEAVLKYNDIAQAKVMINFN